MTQPDPTTDSPDYDAVRETRPGADGGTDEQLASSEGPATASENAVDEDMGSGER
ncbi:MAG: hypothetical protein M3P95_01775 [Actinomycetota bacterium]|jgi:hypothetical protein|nr:hypothetical protein [Actinomycetota bacterium]